MKATGIPLDEIIKRIASRGRTEYQVKDGWCNDIALFQITKEEFMNLQALSNMHPRLEATDEALDDVDNAIKTISPLERMHIGRAERGEKNRH